MYYFSSVDVIKDSSMECTLVFCRCGPGSIPLTALTFSFFFSNGYNVMVTSFFFSYEPYHMCQRATDVYIIYCTTCVRGLLAYIFYCTICDRAWRLYIDHSLLLIPLALIINPMHPLYSERLGDELALRYWIVVPFVSEYAVGINKLLHHLCCRTPDEYSALKFLWRPLPNAQSHQLSQRVMVSKDALTSFPLV